MADFFRRVEKKYVINQKQYESLTDAIKEKMVEDEHGKSTICNIYFDTEQYELIRHSITSPVFKDKIRLRSYNIPNKNSTVYLEIKRKYDGVVSKRRIETSLNRFYSYAENNNQMEEGQIEKELAYYFKHYQLIPTMFLSYKRTAYYEKENRDFRLTFDNDILARNYDLQLEKGNYGTRIYNKEQYIMEIKTLGAMPMWFVKILNELKICPCGFSKYGMAYQELILKENINMRKVI